MSRPVSLAPILCLLALLAGGCRSAGPGGEVPEPRAQGAERNAGRTGSDATPAGKGWAWTAPPPACMGLPGADDREIAFTYGHQHLVLLDAEGRLMWDVYRLGLRDVAPRLTPEAVVVATDDGMAAFRRSDGGKIWDATVAERVNTPVIAGRLAVASTWEGTVIGFDLADGKVAWRAAMPGPSLGPPATDGTTVVATWDRADRRTGGAVAIEASTGRQRWAVPLPGGGISGPTVTPSGSAVAVAGDLAAHALALSSGEPRWRTPVEGAGSAEVPPLVVDARSVLVAHRLGGLDLLDASTGRRTWQVASDGAAVRGGPALGPEGSYAFPLDDGRVLLAGHRRRTELLRPPAGRISGLARGPGGLLVTTVREAPVNSVEAGPAW